MNARDRLLTVIMETRRQVAGHQQLEHAALMRVHHKDPVMDKIIFLMNEGFRNVEIADTLGISRIEIHDLVHKARRIIKKREYRLKKKG